MRTLTVNAGNGETKKLNQQPDNLIYGKNPKMSTTINIDIFAATETETLSAEQKYAYSKFIKGENLFITGPGGTGKTHLIKYLVKYAKSVSKRVDVCAMTGCAAVLLNCNASTIHSWSGIKIARGKKEAVIAGVVRNKQAVSSWKKAKILIIDEVSMLSRKIIEILEESARLIRRSVLPFGGLQVVFCGDFFQLPPIGTEGEPDTEDFCFESPLWNRIFKAENMIQLTTVFRQQGDPIYRNILNQIRRGELTEENKRILQSCVNRKYEGDFIPTKLFPLRVKTDHVNNMMFSKINDKEIVYEIVRKQDCTTYLESEKPIEYDILKICSQLSPADIDAETEFLIQNISAKQVLRLKKGCAVMCLVNLDLELSICNGSQGVVIDFVQSASKIGGSLCPLVKFANGVTKTIEPYSWQSENCPIVCVQQIPLCLAWALTIHKIQGTTLAIAEIDVGQSIFEYGQTYVALSRIQSLDGLYMSSFHPQKIKANPKVLAFYDSIPKIDYDAAAATAPNFDKYMYSDDTATSSAAASETKTVRLSR
jgi:ATP-dependent DNA helicase PIF1